MEPLVSPSRGGKKIKGPGVTKKITNHKETVFALAQRTFLLSELLWVF